MDVKTSIADLKIIIREWSIQSWTKEWEKETDPNQEKPKCRQTKYFYKVPDKQKAKVLLGYNRDNLSMLVRFVTGHAFLKRHNKIVERGTKIGEENEDIYCRLCSSNTEWETPHHLICKCEALMHRRKEIFGDFFLPDDPKWDIKNLMDFLNCSTITDLEDDEE